MLTYHIGERLVFTMKTQMFHKIVPEILFCKKSITKSNGSVLEEHFASNSFGDLHVMSKFTPI